MLLLNYDRTYGAKLNYTTEHRYYFDKFLSLYWPLRSIPRYPYLPYDLLDLWPTEHHLRKIRVRNNLYGF
ncbi:hypothetical protein GWI33_001173 [Rhynchophorus ferrugineus]|uniref:Uncharacterized protein n=1 Tax=Rhynchophorus ferrugineus TaxID=354439 RepID=A0A834INZ7_RHYFE|nr:hypothetical protein GWI33_001173 [Rhynchophorus ferrugineus]